jgi:hypothetical protein
MNFRTTEPVFMKLDISWHQSQSKLLALVCVYLYPRIVTKQGLGKHVCAATHTRANRRIIRCVIFSAVRVISKRRPWASLRKKNSVAWIRERTIPTERPPLVGEANANFCHVVSVTDPYGRILGFLDQKMCELNIIKCNVAGLRKCVF